MKRPNTVNMLGQKKGFKFLQLISCKCIPAFYSFSVRQHSLLSELVAAGVSQWDLSICLSDQ